MDIRHKSTSIRLLSFGTPPMRAFHMTWLAFFLCFFGWFGIAPLMAVMREEMKLTKDQVGKSIIASWRSPSSPGCWSAGCAIASGRGGRTRGCCVGSLPVMGIGLAHRYRPFSVSVWIGIVGASFVITQYHTSMMFAPNFVGTANATTAGWGNLGGGVTQLVDAAAVRRCS